MNSSLPATPPLLRHLVIIIPELFINSSRSVVVSSLHHFHHLHHHHLHHHHHHHNHHHLLPPSMTVATTMAATMSHPAQPLMDMFTPAWIKEDLPTYTPKPRPENKEETKKVEEVEAAVAKLELTSKPARARVVMSPEAVMKHPL